MENLVAAAIIAISLILFKIAGKSMKLRYTLLVGLMMMGGLITVDKYFNSQKPSPPPYGGVTTDPQYYEDQPNDIEYGPGDEGNSGPGLQSVHGYTKSNGTYVAPYTRSKPDGNPYNNLKP